MKLTIYLLQISFLYFLQRRLYDTFVSNFYTLHGVKKYSLSLKTNFKGIFLNDFRRQNILPTDCFGSVKDDSTPYRVDKFPRCLIDGS